MCYIYASVKKKEGGGGQDFQLETNKDMGGFISPEYYVR